MMIRAEQENNIRAAYNLVIFLILFSFQVSFLSHLERRSGDFIDVFYSTKVPLRGLKIKTICENTVDFCSVCADFMVDDLVRIHCGPCLSTGGGGLFSIFSNHRICGILRPLPDAPTAFPGLLPYAGKGPWRKRSEGLRRGQDEQDLKAGRCV